MLLKNLTKKMLNMIDNFFQLIGNTAHAADTSSTIGSSLSSFMPFILIIAVFYFLVIRPQQKKNKEHQTKMNSMARGDEVVTAGGIIGTIISLPTEGDQFIIEIAKDVKVKINKHYIADFISRKDATKEEVKEDKKKKITLKKVKDKAE